jgi:uncharacterized membrane-anchored protein YitT (DUF2179 family)
MKSKILSTLYDYLVISLGTLLFAMSWSCFLIPNGITSGGLTGACTILQFATGGLIPLSISYIIANAILLLLAFLIIGRIVGIRTIYCIALSTVLFRFLPDLDWLQEYSTRPGYKLLLCHHPEFYDKYLKDTDIDLILSGHVHGGQMRILGRGIFSPGQGLFPKYFHGCHDNRLVVSAGSSNTVSLPRWGNPCEVVIINLTGK